MNILLTCAGRFKFIVDEFRKHANVYVVDNSEYNAVNAIKVPKFTNPKYLNVIYYLIQIWKIDKLISFNEEEAIILAKAGIDVYNGNLETLLYCKDKTYPGLPTPEILDVIVKPIDGSGSRGLITQFDGIVQRKLKGIEYQVDILNDDNGNYVTHCVKRKISMRNGQTDKAEIASMEILNILIKLISITVKHRGCLDCDIMFDKDHYYVLDLNPRFGGGYMFTHAAGMNFIKFICTGEKDFNLQYKIFCKYDAIQKRDIQGC